MKKISIFFISLCTIFMVWIFFSADKGELPFFINKLYMFPHGDKIGHLLLIGTFTFLVQQILIIKQSFDIQKKRASRAAFIITILITIEEISQYFIKTRNFSIIDLLFSYLGILLFTCLTLLIINKYKKKK